MSELEFRSATVADVDYPARQIDLVVMPYEAETMIHERTRSYFEVVSAGAFDGIERRANRVRVNRDHDVRRTVGRALAFRSAADGLLAMLKISRTELGDETLELAADEALDASAGFALLRDDLGRVKPGAEVWERRDRRRLNHLWLGHIALTPEPAYEGATVLAVRQAGEPPVPVPSETPNRDRMELERLRNLYADLDRRYGVAQH